ncbi:hypothetical protein T492DRAFT_174634 [Pavlovales sp. CCMP2436]|nr:hypothetical protein T492DRAFT_174634 [Pavlovales sp. CCMP2436]
MESSCDKRPSTSSCASVACAATSKAYSTSGALSPGTEASSLAARAARVRVSCLSIASGFAPVPESSPLVAAASPASATQSPPSASSSFGESSAALEGVATGEAPGTPAKSRASSSEPAAERSALAASLAALAASPACAASAAARLHCASARATRSIASSKSLPPERMSEVPSAEVHWKRGTLAPAESAEGVCSTHRSSAASGSSASIASICGAGAGEPSVAPTACLQRASSRRNLAEAGAPGSAHRCSKLAGSGLGSASSASSIASEGPTRGSMDVDGSCIDGSRGPGARAALSGAADVKVQVIFKRL